MDVENEPRFELVVVPGLLGGELVQGFHYRLRHRFMSLSAIIPIFGIERNTLLKSFGYGNEGLITDGDLRTLSSWIEQLKH